MSSTNFTRILGVILFALMTIFQTTHASTNKSSTSPLVAPWTGPFGGVPAFDKITVSMFTPAMEQGMVEILSDIDTIAQSLDKPTFDNTIAEMERSGKLLKRVMPVYGVFGANLSTPEFRKIEEEMNPKLSKVFDTITQNEKLFKRISQVHENRNASQLTKEQIRLVEDKYKDFVRSGAKLDAKQKARLTEINQELSKLYTSFSQKLLADEGLYVSLESEEDLAGLPPALIDAAASLAKGKKANAKWIVANTRSSVDPFLTYSSRRDLREKVWRMFISRGDNGDANDTKTIISKILPLRQERAKLLGFETHANWRLDNTMAKTPNKAMELMELVWPKAVDTVKREVSLMQDLANREGNKITIEPWDYRYYMEKVRKAKYDIDQNEVKEYLQLDKLREGMFWAAKQIFGLEFFPIKEIPVFQEDVTVYEVRDSDGKHVGLWYFDPYAREGKRSGAWMTDYREQQRMDGEVTTLVSNNSNFIKGKPGEAVLISWDDATTLFHEFGHALHGLSSNVTYPSLAGTSVPRDYVEFPSQVFERWFSTPEVLNQFALHYKTGKPMPQELIKKLEATKTFNQGFATVEYLASALVDMKLHLSTQVQIDPTQFEKTTLASLGMPKEIVMRHRTPQFGHIFSGDGYSAGYYSYLWSDVIASDAYEAFEETKNPFDKAVAAKFKKYIYSAGNSIDPEEAYRLFRGRDPKVEALLRDRGFED